METRKSLVTKLGFITAVAIGIIIIGKKHIQYRKDSRHLKESALSVENELDDFLTMNRRPGFPEHNPNLNYDTPNRKSKFVGAGLSYSSKTPGDRLSIWNVIFKRRDDDK